MWAIVFIFLLCGHLAFACPQKPACSKCTNTSMIILEGDTKNTNPTPPVFGQITIGDDGCATINVVCITSPKAYVSYVLLYGEENYHVSTGTNVTYTIHCDSDMQWVAVDYYGFKFPVRRIECDNGESASSE